MLGKDLSPGKGQNMGKTVYGDLDQKGTRIPYPQTTHASFNKKTRQSTNCNTKFNAYKNKKTN